MPFLITGNIFFISAPSGLLLSFLLLKFTAHLHKCWICMEIYKCQLLYDHSALSLFYLSGPAVWTNLQSKNLSVCAHLCNNLCLVLEEAKFGECISLKKKKSSLWAMKNSHGGSFMWHQALLSFFLRRPCLYATIMSEKGGRVKKKNTTTTKSPHCFSAYKNKRLNSFSMQVIYQLS